ncbi:hypothetical protein ILYODFUR_035741 [Ilyodon furcidens]|uniref:Uncharacterized protein n=1 Tax=Ilyodon furcidens TaxID=33524 RepID=A0ABV0VJU9_9TELE
MPSQEENIRDRQLDFLNYAVQLKIYTEALSFLSGLFCLFRCSSCTATVLLQFKANLTESPSPDLKYLLYFRPLWPSRTLKNFYNSSFDGESDASSAMFVFKLHLS